MGVFGRVLSRGYCAFCKAERDYILKKHVGVLEVLGAAAFSVCVGSALWSWYEPKTLVIFALALSASEMFVYLRWRSHVVCRFCGFDPVLYNSAPNRAREKVRAFYEAKIKDPEFLLSKSPLLELHKKSLRQEALKQRLRRVKNSEPGSVLAPTTTKPKDEIQSYP